MFTKPRTNATVLNQFPKWKYWLIVILIVVGVIYALPNIFGESPALQISAKGGKALTQTAITQVEKMLKADGIAYHGETKTKYLLSMRFNDTSQQLKAQDAIREALGKDYTVAINLVPNTPKWLQALGANPMKYGLDLRGGMYFLLNVDMQTVLRNNLDNFAVQMRTDLRKQDIRYSGLIVTKTPDILIRFRKPAATDKAYAFIQDKYQQLTVSKVAKQPLALRVNLSAAEIKQAKQFAVEQTIQVMRNRVNELGVAEASVSREGANRVVIELPGVQDAAKAKEVIGGTSTLKLMLVNESADLASAVHGQVPIGSTLYHFSSDLGGGPIVLKNRVILTGKSIVGATVGYGQNSGLPVVNVKLSGPEVSEFSRVTGENVGKRMAIVLVQSTFEKKKVHGKAVTQTNTTQEVVNAAVINQQLGNAFVIEGMGSMRAAQLLALNIRAGALPAPVQIAESKIVGPSLGQDNIRMGEISVCVAMLLVIIFIAIYYRLFGVIADVALLLNLVFIVAIMSIIPGATLSLAGIAGIVLNVGMAIDSNVLIFERIREELRNGNTPQAAIHAGYERAFATIVDSNVTTLIVAVILFAVGTSAIKGFAVTLTIGILTSMFTAITFTRALVNLIYGRRRSVKKLSIGI